MELTSNLITKKKGAYEASIRADYIDGVFHSVSFGVVTRSGEPLDLYITLGDCGLEHSYSGEDKDKVDEIVGLLSAKVARETGITFSERPQIEEMREEIPEGSNNF